MGPDSREDITLQAHILPHPELKDFKIAIHYETVGRTSEFSDYSNIGPDFSYLAEHYFGHKNYLKIDGKPVVIVYLTRVLSSLGTLQSSLNAMREAADAWGYELYIMGDEVFGAAPPLPGNIALLDGIMNYDVYGSMSAHDYAGQAAVGSLFRAMLQEAKQLTDPDIGHMILVTSWNEWHEDTQIEPVCPSDPTSQDDSTSGTDFTQGLAYEGYATRYLDILNEETSQTIFADGFESRDTTGFICDLNQIVESK